MAVHVEGAQVAPTWTDGPISGGVTWTDSPESAARRTSAGRWNIHVDLDRSGRWGWDGHVAVIGNRSYATAETRVIVARG